MDHQVRRRALSARLGEHNLDAMLVTSLPNLRYLTGFTGSNGQLIAGADGAAFLTDGRYTTQARRELTGLEPVTYARGYGEAILEQCAALGVTRLGLEADDVTLALHKRLASKLPGIELVPTEGVVEDLRTAKDEDELVSLRRAQAVTDEAFDAVLEHVLVGVSERQLATDLERVLRQSGADGLAFPSIVAFGDAAAEPHHEPGDRRLEEGDVIKLDFGAKWDGYHSDMTRTVAFGDPPNELRKIHDLVREAQRSGIAAIHAGVTGGEVDRAARSVIEAAGYGDQFTHGTGHGVGLQIHEAPRVAREMDDVLPVGAVVTVEPGVYLPGLGGVRIEDMVEVTADGGTVLGSSPRELIEL